MSRSSTDPRQERDLRAFLDTARRTQGAADVTRWLAERLGASPQQQQQAQAQAQAQAQSPGASSAPLPRLCTVLDGADLSDCRLEGIEMSSVVVDPQGKGVLKHIEQPIGFRDARLVRASLRGSRAAGVCFARADARAAVFAGCSLLYADLTDAQLGRASLSSACLDRASLRGVVAPSADFSGASLHTFCNMRKAAAVDWSAATPMDIAAIEPASFVKADLVGANLENAKLCGADFREANLSGASLRGADLRGANFDLTTLRGVNFGGADVRGARGVETADVTNAVMLGGVIGAAGFCSHKNSAHIIQTQQDLLRSSWETRDMMMGSFMVNLSNEDLRGLSFEHCNLARSCFRNALMDNCDFTCANLTGACFVGARMFGVRLSGASLAASDFTGANLLGAYLCGMAAQDWRSINGLSAAVLMNAISSGSESVPEDVRQRGVIANIERLNDWVACQQEAIAKARAHFPDAFPDLTAPARPQAAMRKRQLATKMRKPIDDTLARVEALRERLAAVPLLLPKDMSQSLYMRAVAETVRERMHGSGTAGALGDVGSPALSSQDLSDTASVASSSFDVLRRDRVAAGLAPESAGFEASETGTSPRESLDCRSPPRTESTGSLTQLYPRTRSPRSELADSPKTFSDSRPPRRDPPLAPPRKDEKERQRDRESSKSSLNFSKIRGILKGHKSATPASDMATLRPGDVRHALAGSSSALEEGSQAGTGSSCALDLEGNALFERFRGRVVHPVDGDALQRLYTTLVEETGEDMLAIAWRRMSQRPAMLPLPTYPIASLETLALEAIVRHQRTASVPQALAALPRERRESVEYLFKLFGVEATPDMLYPELIFLPPNKRAVLLATNNDRVFAGCRIDNVDESKHGFIHVYCARSRALLQEVVEVPESPYFMICTSDGKVWFTTKDGVYICQPKPLAQELFVGSLTPQEPLVSGLAEVTSKSGKHYVWYFAALSDVLSQIVVIRPDGTIAFKFTIKFSVAYMLYYDGAVWVAGHDQLVLCSPEDGKIQRTINLTDKRRVRVRGLTVVHGNVWVAVGNELIAYSPGGTESFRLAMRGSSDSETILIRQICSLGDMLVTGERCCAPRETYDRVRALPVHDVQKGVSKLRGEELRLGSGKLEIHAITEVTGSLPLLWVAESVESRTSSEDGKWTRANVGLLVVWSNPFSIGQPPI
eukprot:m51a1_g9689 hypothetical protein (1181) ;mRNA; f:1331732-1336940